MKKERKIEISPADGLSGLPDEILHRILIAADLDLKLLAQTSILSRRWRPIWQSSLTKLHFGNIPLKVDEWNSFAQFVENVLSFRKRPEYRGVDLEAISLTTDGMLRPHMFHLLEKIFTHGVKNRVRTFRLSVGLGRVLVPVPPGLSALCASAENLELSVQAEVFMALLLETTSFSPIRMLRLYRCVLIPPIEMALEVPGTRRALCILLKAPNLTKLEFIECDFRSRLPIQICSSTLIDLVIVWPREPDSDFMFPPDMTICAHQMKSFTCKEMRLHLVQSLKLPSLEYLDIDVFLHSDISNSSEKELEASLYVFRFFQRVAGLKRLKLHPSTLTALIMVPGLLEIEESPFKGIECVEFHNGSTLISDRSDFNALISYFFGVHWIQGNALFDRIFAQSGASDHSSSRTVVVYKSDLV